jgi:hypothetical protein
MREFTQSNTDPGNCWQTAVACILEEDPARLPDQVDLEARGKNYHNALNAYLEVHHGLIYAEVEDFVWCGIWARDPGWHVMIGPTVRTCEPKNIHHVIVARHGAPMWDPHPSRAGLLEIRRWGLLNPLPERIRLWRREVSAKSPSAWEFGCVCPECAKPASPPTT